MLQPQKNLSQESLLLLGAIEAEEQTDAAVLGDSACFRVSLGAVMRTKATLQQLSSTVETFFELRCQPGAGIDASRWTFFALTSPDVPTAGACVALCMCSGGGTRP